MYFFIFIFNLLNFSFFKYFIHNISIFFQLFQAFLFLNIQSFFIFIFCFEILIWYIFLFQLTFASSALYNIFQSYEFFLSVFNFFKLALFFKLLNLKKLFFCNSTNILVWITFPWNQLIYSVVSLNWHRIIIVK